MRTLKSTLYTLIMISLLTACQQEIDKPNIIFFLVDDMGWQDTSEPFWTERTPFNDRYNTPNMEKLADQGVKFTNAYSCAVCSPTRISWITGMNAARHRVTNWTLNKNQKTDANSELLIIPEWNMNGLSPDSLTENAVYAKPLPMILSQNGYLTIHCGKAHFGANDTPGSNPLNLGFQVNIAGHAAGAPGSYLGTENFGNDSLGKPKGVWSVPGLESYHGKDIFLTEALTLEAIKALDSARIQNKPFFLYMAHYAVHTPLYRDKRFDKKYEMAGLPEPEIRYSTLIEGMDKSLGDLMEYLEDNGLEDNTIVLFTSDNGGLSVVARGGVPNTHNKPLSSGKGSAHEGGIREPMLVKWPGITKNGGIIESYVIIEDFFPSILEMAGIVDYETPQQIDGISFTPLLKKTGDPSIDRPIFWHSPNNWGQTGPGLGASSSVRLGSWKLIYYHQDQSFELFNLDDDISETNNLAGSKPEKIKELSTTLGEYLRSVDAQMPVDKKTGLQVSWPDENTKKNL
jgi:arylsulfatase A-like enzyme